MSIHWNTTRRVPLAMVLAGGMAVAGFGWAQTPDGELPIGDQSEKGATAASATLYTCPIHRQVQWTQAVDCPICGMKLVAEESSPRAPERRRGNKQEGAAEARERGRRLFLANCASCHGSDARSGCMMAPSLVGITKRMNAEEIASHSRALGQRMCCARHLTRLSDEEYADIVAFLDTLPEETEQKMSESPKLESAPRRTVRRGCCR